MLGCFDDRACGLGEGAMWHPKRAELFWFDITGKRMLSRNTDGGREWQFDEMCSAAGWVDTERLVIASETGLWQFMLNSGKRDRLCNLEAEDARTRSNDGRVDPWGGFWISTMGKLAEPGAGSIWRWYRGELRKLYSNLTIPNSICFDELGGFAHFSDTPTQHILRVPLDAEGWPSGTPERWLSLASESLSPDGAIIDAYGLMWIAQWGAGRVAAYGSGGAFVRSIDVPAKHVSCPAFGGDRLETLYCTSATQGLDAEEIKANPYNGITFFGQSGTCGRNEYRMLIS
jgi:sugar lactone lactonase YvrE